MHQHERAEEPHSSGAQAAEWDARYSENETAKWSGMPNGRLVAEVLDLVPGRALDIGCGEGADAIWLAERGWMVTAIDISAVAISRAKNASAIAGVSVDWVTGNALETSFPAGSFDLVSLQYPALPKAGAGGLRRLLDSLSPGGLLLAVYHDLDGEHRDHMKSRGVDPADYIGADDLALLLGDGFTVESRGVVPRIDPPPGTPHVADVILRARRLANETAR
jgi:SAM-dependent methyltransferase